MPKVYINYQIIDLGEIDRRSVAFLFPEFKAFVSLDRHTRVCLFEYLTVLYLVLRIWIFKIGIPRCAARLAKIITVGIDCTLCHCVLVARRFTDGLHKVLAIPRNILQVIGRTAITPDGVEVVERRIGVMGAGCVWSRSSTPCWWS